MRVTIMALSCLALVSVSVPIPVSPALAQSQIEYPDIIESKARNVGRQLRCVVCQNQSIEESDAPLAADMRELVRERLAAGDSEADIIALMRDRYGDYVLLMPPVQGNTIILWLGPAALFLILLMWWGVFSRRIATERSITGLSEEEETAFSALRSPDR